MFFDITLGPNDRGNLHHFQRAIACCRQVSRLEKFSETQYRVTGHARDFESQLRYHLKEWCVDCTFDADVVEAPAPEPVPETEPEPESLELDATDEALGVLDLSVKAIRKALATGDYDAYLEAILAAEKAGKTRKSAVALIEDRMG